MENTLNASVSIYALGGLGEVGKNMYCIENNKSLVIIDCGVRFPDSNLPGIDYLVPDFTHLKNNRNKIKALIITHGHEDHIGGIPFLLQSVNIPFIYAPRLACALIQSRLEENRLLDRTRILEYDSTTHFRIDDFSFSFFRVTHSIPDSFGVVVDTPEGRIVSTGDFKIDLTPVGPDIELNRIAEIGSEGVDLLLSDSTNAENEGYTPSEKNVLDSIQEIFNQALGRVIVSTFSSNISRIQQICEVAVAHNRKVAIVGRSMSKAVDLSRNFGYIHVPDSAIIDAANIKKYRNSELLIICTGSQGEPMAALSRIAAGEHKDVHIYPGDTVVFSSSAIPGNGVMIDHVVNLLVRCGANVITNSILSDIHSSGHPAKQELRIMLKLMKPKYFMPMHGEYRMLLKHAQIAEDVGVKKGHSFVLENGDVLCLYKHRITRDIPVESGVTYIDGKDIRGLSDAVMADRKIMTDDGAIIIAIALDSKNNKLLSTPEMICKGFIGCGNKKMMDGCLQAVSKAIDVKLNNRTTFNDLKTAIKDSASAYVFAQTRSHPLIIPLVMNKN